jgi:hypothetical protein
VSSPAGYDDLVTAATVGTGRGSLVLGRPGAPAA